MKMAFQSQCGVVLLSSKIVPLSVQMSCLGRVSMSICFSMLTGAEILLLVQSKYVEIIILFTTR